MMTIPKPDKNGIVHTGGHFEAGNSGNRGIDALNDDWLHIVGRKRRGEPYEELCEDCEGYGERDGKTCKQCGGDGIVFINPDES
jgi:hypothetical protein